MLLFMFLFNSKANNCEAKQFLSSNTTIFYISFNNSFFFGKLRPQSLFEPGINGVWKRRKGDSVKSKE